LSVYSRSCISFFFLFFFRVFSILIFVFKVYDLPVYIFLYNV